MRRDIERVAEVFEEFRSHPIVAKSFFVVHRDLIAANLTAAYFANNETRSAKPKLARKK